MWTEDELKRQAARLIITKDKRIQELEQALRQARVNIVNWALNPMHADIEMNGDLAAIDKALEGNSNE
jgi:LPS O-antigen subunit length determinant protein (WzzB/FepE family)